jgi:uncharacterized protein (UPF0264 family)
MTIQERRPDWRQPEERRGVCLLASVQSEAEARIAAASGADIIDCKNPREGALGALPHATVAAIRKAVPAPVPVSATIGDIPADPGRVAAAVAAMAATGADIVKIGLFPGADREATIRRAGAERTSGIGLVAVMLADAAPDVSLIPVLGEAGFTGVMLDTAGKDGRSLVDHCDRAYLVSFLAAARAAGLMSGLAGSLRVAHIPELLALAPDVLGFRGALCQAADRRGALDAAAMRAVRCAIPRSGEETAPLSPLASRAAASALKVAS